MGKGMGGQGRRVSRLQSIGRCSGSLPSAKLAHFWTDLSGRVVTVKIDLKGKTFQIINVYAPNNQLDRQEFFDSLRRFSFCNIDSIVAGDLNCVLDVALDKWGGNDRFGNKAVLQLHSFTKSFSLEDFCRITHQSGRLFTRFNGPYSVGCRLNRFYTPRAWRLRVSAHACTALISVLTSGVGLQLPIY